MQSSVFKNDENDFLPLKDSLIVKVCLIFSSILSSFLIFSLLNTFKIIF